MADRYYEEDRHHDAVDAAPPTTGGFADSPSRAGAPAWMRTGRPALHRLMRNRRQALMTMGAGAAALSAIGSGAAVYFGDSVDSPAYAAGEGGGANVSPREAGSFADRDASYVSDGGDGDLGAAGLAETASAAAAAALRKTPRYPSPLSRDPVLHLLRRATFGPTPADVTTVKQIGIDAWIDRQLEPEKLPDPTLDQVMMSFPTVNMTTPQLRTFLPEDKRNQAMDELSRSTVARQIWTTRQLYEVMVEFWNNHLNMINPMDGGWAIRPPYDREVIRKHAFGKFSDMLHASARSAAMMRYLDNASSDKRNVNENYGRELLELHTVGVDGGYTERDVRNSAYLMTGRTIDQNDNFRYEANRHWTGTVKVLGFQHANKSTRDGLAVGDAYVAYLATHPSTARYIARKLAVRFVADNPPQSLVDRLAKTYQESGTAIVPVLRVLFRSVEFWIATGLKTRRPLENFVAAARVVGVRPGADTPKALEEMFNFSRKLGQPPLGWEPPNGYPDVAKAWSSAAGMLETWNGHRYLVEGWKGLSTPKGDDLLAGPRPVMVGQYIDALANRLLYQPMKATDRAAILKFLGATEATRVNDASLGGKLTQIAPIILDSVYHALR